jgi:2-dehydro-3-deoxyglucarate aldolase
MNSEIRSVLKSGKTSIGSWIQIPDPTVAEIMSRAGYDWIAVDMEHGSFSIQSLPGIFRALELGGTAPFVRVAQAEPKDIKQALDAGAKGLILPMIETGEQLSDAISWALYPPQGRRGVGYCRANKFGKDLDSYIKDSEGLLIVAQIEHILAVNNLDDILQVKGLDAIMVGPYDLSCSMKITGKFHHARFIQAMNTIFSKAREYKIPMGTHLVQPDIKLLESKIAEGYQFIAYGVDTVFLCHAAELPQSAIHPKNTNHSKKI